jgi:hypothetical protein
LDIRVLEQEIMQAKRMDDSADAHAMYRIQMDLCIDLDNNLLQLLKGKDDLLEGMRALEVEKSQGLETLNPKRMTLFEVGYVWLEEDGAN